jgi:hypothetical protein
MTRPAALFDAEGRKRLARVVVWGSSGARLTRGQIERRLQIVLERIAKKVNPDGEDSRPQMLRP